MWTSLYTQKHRQRNTDTNIDTDTQTLRWFSGVPGLVNIFKNQIYAISNCKFDSGLTFENFCLGSTRFKRWRGIKKFAILSGVTPDVLTTDVLEQSISNSHISVSLIISKLPARCERSNVRMSHVTRVNESCHACE